MPRLIRPPDMPEGVQAAIDIIGSQARTAILRHLARRPMTAVELAQAIGANHSSAHRHLKALEALGLVHADREAGHRTGGVIVKWATDLERVEELGRAWTAYAQGL